MTLAARFCGAWRNLARFGGTVLHLTAFGEFWRDLTECCEILRDSARFDGIWRGVNSLNLTHISGSVNLTDFDRIWRLSARFGEICVSFNGFWRVLAASDEPQWLWVLSLFKSTGANVTNLQSLDLRMPRTSNALGPGALGRWGPGAQAPSPSAQAPSSGPTPQALGHVHF